MKILRNEKGFAMVFVLILAAISLAISLAMLMMVSRGSFLSGQQMRFRTAVEASRGGMEAMFQLISSRGNLSTSYTNLAWDNVGIGTKLVGPTSGWGSLDQSLTIDSSVPTSYDMRIDLGTYRVYTKIVDTVNGNSGGDEGLINTGVVNAGSGEVKVESVPYLYTIEVLSQSTTNPTERSKLSILYQY